MKKIQKKQVSSLQSSLALLPHCNRCALLLKLQINLIFAAFVLLSVTASANISVKADSAFFPIRQAAPPKQTTGDNISDFREIDLATPYKPRVALTYDDGPLKRTTPKLLDILKEKNVSAAFFIVGYRSENHPEILKRIVDEGHILGNHTQSHTNLNRLSEEDIEREIESVNKLITDVGAIPKYFRPPYGNANKRVSKVIEATGMEKICWNIDTLDWKNKNVKSIVKSALSHLSDGSIILMHDAYMTSVDATEILIDEIRSLGFEIVPLNEISCQ